MMSFIWDTNYQKYFILLYLNLTLVVMCVGPFVIKQRLKVTPLMLLFAFMFFEGAPLLIFLYPFVVSSLFDGYQSFGTIFLYSSLASFGRIVECSSE